jgi:hypothetical protein
MAQQFIETLFEDGTTLLSNIRNQFTNEIETYSKVTTWHDGSTMNDSKVDGFVYVKKGSDYFFKNYIGSLLFSWFPLNVPNHTIYIKAAIKACKSGGKIIFPEKMDLKISDFIHIDKEIEIDFSGCTLKVVNSTPSFGGGPGFQDAMIKITHDRAKIYNFHLDGNMTQRTFVFTEGRALSGVYIQNASHCIVDNATMKGIGARRTNLAADNANVTAPAAGVYVDISDDFEGNVENNIVRNIEVDDSDYCLSFLFRCGSNLNINEGAGSGYYVQNNLFKNSKINGCVKHPVELVGPYCRNNRVEKVRGFNFAGQSGFDIDFGASYNTIKDCEIVGRASNSDLSGRHYTPGTWGSFGCSGFDKRNDGLTGFVLQTTRGNKFDNCTLRDINLPSFTSFCWGFFDFYSDGTIFENCRAYNVNLHIDANFSLYGTRNPNLTEGEPISKNIKINRMVGEDGSVVNGFRFSNVGNNDNITITNCSVKCKNYGVWAAHKTANLNISNNNIEAENETFFMTYGRNLRISDNYLKTNTNAVCIRLPEKTEFNRIANVSGNTIENIIGTGVCIVRGEGVLALEGFREVNNTYIGRGVNSASRAKISFGKMYRNGNMGFDLNNSIHENNIPSVFWDNGPPDLGAANTFRKNDIVYNTDHSIGSPLGWVCVDGAPENGGIWAAFGVAELFGTVNPNNTFTGREGTRYTNLTTGEIWRKTSASSSGFGWIRVDNEGAFVSTRTANYTSSINDFYIPVDSTGASRTVTLPGNSSRASKRFLVRHVAGANNITVSAGNSLLIEGNSTYIINSAGLNVEFTFDGTQYIVTNKFSL